MKLAVRKDEGSVPGGGYHYNVHPMKMRDDFEAAVYQQMGYVIIDIHDHDGTKLITDARLALKHQLEVAQLTALAEGK